MAHVATEGRRVARDVGDGPRRQREHPVDDVRARAAPRRVEHDEVGSRHGTGREPALDGCLVDPHVREVVEVATRVAAGADRRLDRVDRSGDPDVVGQAAGEQADARVQVDKTLAGPRLQRGADGVDQRVGGTGVHLPEALGRDPPLTPARLLAHPGAPTQPGHGDVGGK